MMVSGNYYQCPHVTSMTAGQCFKCLEEKATDLSNEPQTSKQASSEAETQLTLLTPEELKRQFEMTYQPEITDLEANEYRGEHRPVVYVDNAVKVAMMMFTQALTSLKSEMEKKKIRANSAFVQVGDPLLRQFKQAEANGNNNAISECQKLLEDKVNGGTQHGSSKTNIG